MNKSLEFLSTVDVAAISAPIIVDFLEDKVQNENVFTQLFSNKFNLTESNYAVIPKFQSTIQVTYGLASGSSIESSTLAYDGTTVSIAKWGMAIEIPKEEIKCARRNIFTDFLNNSDYPFQLDKRAETVLLDLQTGTLTITSGTVNSTTLCPIIEVTGVSGGTISSIDYFSGTVTLTGEQASTITFLYSNLLKETGLVTTSQSLSIDDVFSLRNSMTTNSINPSVILVNPANLGSLLYSASDLFVNSKLYNPTFNAEVGNIAGLSVLSSGIVPLHSAILVDSKKSGYDITQRPLQGKRKELRDRDMVGFYLYEQRDFALSNSLSVGLVCVN